EVDPASLVENALNGALQSLDPHSSYVPPVDFTEQREAVRREYGGLGIEIQSEGGLVKVNFAIEEGPAYKAGIRGGDFITAVDGTDIRGKSLDEAVSGMRGLKGEAVTVTVLSPDKVARDIVVVRDTVRGRAIRHRVEQGVGYIQIETFNNDKLTEDTERALADLNTRLGKLDKLVIDLRGNRGGLLTESVSISGLFLDGGEVLSARGRDASDNERYNAEDGELYPDAKIVVLVSPGSASAAEIVAGALQDRGRGVVLGRRSFGKGSVQSVIPLGAEDGALRLTTQRYYTPSGASIQGRGIMPDLLVSSLEDSGEIRKRFREDSLRNFLSNPDETDYEEKYDDILYAPDTFPDDEDFQLRKAVEVLKTSQYERLLQAQSEKY
ncbi:MAG: S41 family peptidase, partial [Sneathiella sp.]